MSSDEEDVLSVLAIVDAISGIKHRIGVKPRLQQHNDDDNNILFDDSKGRTDRIGGRCAKRLHFNIYQEILIKDRIGLRYSFRISEADFEELVLLIRPDVQKSFTWRKDIITPEMRLGITLRFLTTGDSYTSLMNRTKISKQQLSKLVPEVCWALYNRLKGTYLKLPTFQREWKKISKGFETRWNFPHVIGALDEKRVIMEAPGIKRTNSVFLTMVDYNYNFIYADVGSQDRLTDGSVFKNSILNKDLQSRTPNSDPLPRREMCVPYFMLGSNSFPLLEFLMTPYSGKFIKGSRECVFNNRLCYARRTVENAFGIMGSVFKILKKPLTVKVDTVIPLLLACVTLHNYLRRNKASAKLYSPPGFLDTENSENGEIIPGYWRTEPLTEAFQQLPRQPGGSPIEAQILRDEISYYFINVDVVQRQNNNDQSCDEHN